MIRFEGFDENGQVKTSECKKHSYDDLPMKGLGKSFEGVDIDEPVIISHSVALDPIIWGYSKAEIERRAYELGANINWKELPPERSESQGKLQMWFSKEESLNKHNYHK